MKKRLIPAAALLAAALAFSGTAFAEEQPTDAYGNVIDWDVNGSGNEDGAGLEDLETDASESDAASETYSFQEQAEVFSQMEAAETEAPAETGLLTVKLGDVPSDWSKNNIRLSLYRGNAKEDIFLYRQSDWTQSAQIPVGHYTVYKVETLDGREAFHSDITTFDVTTETAVNLTLSYGDQETVIPDVTEAEETAPMEIDPGMTNHDVQSNGFYIAIIVAAIFVLSGICWIGKRSRDGRDNIDKSSLD